MKPIGGPNETTVVQLLLSILGGDMLWASYSKFGGLLSLVSSSRHSVLTYPRPTSPSTLTFVLTQHMCRPGSNHDVQNVVE
jgi:hypothetical protein